MYNSRYTDHDRFKYFKDAVSFTADDVATFISDESNNDALAICSPSTLFYTQLATYLANMLAANERLEYTDTVRICLCFNPLKCTKVVGDYYYRLVNTLSPKLTFSVVGQPIHLLPEQSLMDGQSSKFQACFIYDLVSFLDDKSASGKLFGDALAYFYTLIGSPKRFDPTISIPPAGEIKKMFDQTEAALGICSNFHYIDLSVR